MSKNLIDYNELDRVINKKSYRLIDVKDKIEKVAFDIVRFKDNDKGADLWQIQSSDDGEYIISLYEESKDNIKTASHNAAWGFDFDAKGNIVQFYYKGDPIAKIACNDIGFSPNDVRIMSKHFTDVLSTSQSAVNNLLNTLDASTRKEILNKYPELETGTK